MKKIFTGIAPTTAPKAAPAGDMEALADHLVACALQAHRLAEVPIAPNQGAAFAAGFYAGAHNANAEAAKLIRRLLEQRERT